MNKLFSLMAVFVVALGFSIKVHAFDFGLVSSVVSAAGALTTGAEVANDAKALGDMNDTRGTLRHAGRIGFEQVAEYLDDEQVDSIVTGMQDYLQKVQGQPGVAEGGPLPKFDHIDRFGDEKPDYTISLYSRGNSGVMDALSRLNGQRHYGLKVVDDEGNQIADQALELSGDEDRDIEFIKANLAQMIVKAGPSLFKD